MTAELRIAMATRADLPSLARFVAQLWTAHSEVERDRGDAAELRATALLDGCQVSFFHLQDARVGYAGVQDLGDYMLIRHFLIDERQRGRGVGRRAFEALKARFFADRPARLDVALGNAAGRKFWEVMGFTAHAVAMQSNAIQYGAVQAVDVQASALQSGDPQPGAVQPGDLQPGDLQPGDLQPGALQPGALQPGLADRG